MVRDTRILLVRETGQSYRQVDEMLLYEVHDFVGWWNAEQKRLRQEQAKRQQTGRR